MDVSNLSFDHLVETYYQALFRFGLSLTRRDEEASDLTQQTFYLWATKGHQLRDQTKVKSWLFTTLHREFLGRQRRATRFPHHEVEAVHHELPTVEPGIVNQLDGQSAIAALQEVDELYRAPLCLFYLNDLSYKEIAQALDIPIGTVMSRLSRGKSQLREIVLHRSNKESGKLVEFPSMDNQKEANG